MSKRFVNAGWSYCQSVRVSLIQRVKNEWNGLKSKTEKLICPKMCIGINKQVHASKKMHEISSIN